MRIIFIGKICWRIEFSFCSSFLFAPTGELASTYVLSFLKIDLFVSRIELDFFFPFFRSLTLVSWQPNIGRSRCILVINYKLDL